jgi:protein-S-isoprenylcysteine O-methyltransferase Ste14
MNSSKPPWWKGHRGEGYVVVQGLLFALILMGPQNAPGMPAWPGALASASLPAGIALIVFGVAVVVVAFNHLGENLTPLPRPRDAGTLVTTGLYRFVRHPIYFGVIVMALGWVLCVQGLLTLLYAAALFVFFDIKSRREEQWLRERFREYADYQQRVRKLVPFIY